jgi:hypothetical protein
MAYVTNLLEQVYDLSGATTDSPAVETWLLDAARQISKYGKVAGKIGEFTQITTAFLDDSPTTASVDDIGEIIKVTRGGGSQPVRVCRYVDQNEFARASAGDSDSIYYNNSNDYPIYTIKSNGTNSMLVVWPTPAATTGIVDIEFIPEYALTADDSTANIDYFPRKYYYLCVYYAAIQELGRKILDLTLLSDEEEEPELLSGIQGYQAKLQQCQAMYQEGIQLEFQISLKADALDKQGA